MDITNLQCTVNHTSCKSETKYFCSSPCSLQLYTRSKTLEATQHLRQTQFNVDSLRSMLDKMGLVSHTFTDWEVESLQACVLLLKQQMAKESIGTTIRLDADYG